MKTVRRLTVARTQALTTAQQITAVFRHPALYELAAVIPDRSPVGRPAQHPGYLLLGYGVLARVFRSGARVEAELAQPAMWRLVTETVADMADRLPDGLTRLPGDRPPGWDAWKYARNRHLTDPDLLAELGDRFTAAAVVQAKSMGLLDPAGPGSLCHPDRSSVVYGDGTVIRPMYRPPRAKRVTDKRTGAAKVIYLDAADNPIDAPARRFDPDAADYHGHTGPVHGQNYVCLYARGDAPHQRVVLAADRVDAPGQEAATAVELAKRLHTVAGSGMKVLVYDGALRGTHIEDLMTSCGLIVVNKVAAQPLTEDARAARGCAKAPKWYPLGTWEHDTPTGPCTHQLSAVNGAVCQTGLDEAGEPVVLDRLDRKQVKRSRRASGRHHFNVGYHVPCAQDPTTGGFLAWVTPHGEAGDTDARRAENVRIIAEGEPDFTRLYALRNDAEAFNAHLKRTLLVDRAMSLGGARQLLDVVCYGLLNNAVTAHHTACAAATRSGAASRRAA
jgi:hypothetical protein